MPYSTGSAFGNLREVFSPTKWLSRTKMGLTSAGNAEFGPVAARFQGELRQSWAGGRFARQIAAF